MEAVALELFGVDDSGFILAGPSLSRMEVAALMSNLSRNGICGFDLCDGGAFLDSFSVSCMSDSERSMVVNLASALATRSFSDLMSSCM